MERRNETVMLSQVILWGLSALPGWKSWIGEKLRQSLIFAIFVIPVDSCSWHPFLSLLVSGWNLEQVPVHTSEAKT
jgi:hypothetical protein